MIDSKTRKKIIALWRQGKSKAAIQRQTGVTQPTIRKIIDKVEVAERNSVEQSDNKNENEKSKKNVQPISTSFENKTSLICHKFILNFTKSLFINRVKGNTFQVLAQGVVPEVYRKLFREPLETMFGPHTVAAIDAQLQSYDLRGHAFEVRLEQGLYGTHKIQIRRLTTAETRGNFVLPGEKPIKNGYAFPLR